MKFELKQKEIKEKLTHNNKPLAYVFSANYCELDNFKLNEIGYTRGVYGWNFDLIEFEGNYITTGYRGMIGYRINYDFLQNCNMKIPYFENRPKILQKIFKNKMRIKSFFIDFNAPQLEQQDLEYLSKLKKQQGIKR